MRSEPAHAAAGDTTLEPRLLLAAGDLDTTFSSDGLAQRYFGLRAGDASPVNALRAGVQDIVEQSNGKIVTVGSASGIGTNSTQDQAVADQVCVARFNADGTLDTTFNGTGFVIINPTAPTTRDFLESQAYCVALQTINGEERILIGGTVGSGAAIGQLIYDGLLIRLNPNGSRDTTFSGDGFAILHGDDEIFDPGGHGDLATLTTIRPNMVTDLVVNPEDQSILLVGPSLTKGYVVLERLSRDADQFGGIGVSADDDWARLRRLDNGTAEVAVANSLGTTIYSVPQPSYGDPFAEVTDEFDPNYYDTQLWDTVFKYSTPLVLPAASQTPAGAWVLAGANGTQWNVLRLNASSDDVAGDFNGGQPLSVSIPGSYTAQGATAVAADFGGRILAAGYVENSSGKRDFAVIRVTEAGALDPAWSGDGIVVVPFNSQTDAARGMRLDAHGKVLVGGFATTASDGSLDFALARLQTDLDPTSNQAPVIAGLGTPQTWTETDPAPKRYMPSATVTDLDSPNFAGGELTARITAQGQSGDQLNVRNEGTGAGKVGVSGSVVSYGGVTIGTLTAGTWNTPLRVQFNSAATVAAVQAVVRNLNFTHTTDDPTANPRSIRLQLTDGDGGTSAAVTQTLNVTPVNDPPVIPFFSSSQTYFENQSNTIFFDPVSDPDSDFVGGRVTLQFTANAQAQDLIRLSSLNVGGNVVVGGVVIGTATGGAGSTPLVIDFNSQTTKSLFDAVLFDIEYVTLSDTPSTLPRTLRATVLDGDGGSAAATRTVDVIAVNDAPIVDAFDTTITYTENGSGNILDSNATVTDPDSANYDGGTLFIDVTANRRPEDRLEIRNQGTAAGQVGISGNNVLYGGTVIGTFTGGSDNVGLIVFFNAQAGAVQARSVLRNVLFRSVSENPSTLPRTVTVTLSDGDGDTSLPRSKTVQVVAVNDPPVIGAFDGTTPYTENGSGNLVDSNATVADVDSANFAGGQLTLQITANADPSDRLEIRSTGTAAGQVSVSGSNVSYGGVLVGTFTGGSGTTPLVVTFNAASNPNAARGVLRAVQFKNVSDNPSTAPRTIRATLSDGDGGTSAPQSKTVTVTAVDDLPVLANLGTTVNYPPSSTGIVITSTGTITDVDTPDLVGGKLTVALTNTSSLDRLAIRHQGTAAGQVGVSGSNITYGGAVVGTFSGGSGTKPLVILAQAGATPEVVQAVLRNITFRVASGTPTTTMRTAGFTLTCASGTTLPVTKSITVAPNTAPVLGGVSGTLAYSAGGAATVIASGATVADADSFDLDAGKLTVALTAGASSLDRLAIRNQGTAAGQIGVSGSNVTFAGVVIGTFSGGSGATAFVVTLNASATPSAVQALARNITFRVATGTPTITPRTVRFTLTDGDGGTSNAVTKTINVSASHQAQSAPQSAELHAAYGSFADWSADLHR